jgi:hypothetical protein
MGNNIASTFIQRIRNSALGTTLVSQTTAAPPLFLDPTLVPGAARAWVSFDGMVLPNTDCPIITKSSLVESVCSRPTVGEYEITFAAGAFTDNKYLVTGSVFSDRVSPVSAANTFFIKGGGYVAVGFVGAGMEPNLRKFRIQTLNTINVTTSAIPALASRVNLVIYK